MTAFDPDRPVSMTKPLPSAPDATLALPGRPSHHAPAPHGPTAGPPMPFAQPSFAQPLFAQPPFGQPPVAYPTVVMPQQSNAEIIVAWVFTGLTLLYMLPWAVAATRRSTNSVLIALATFFLAWTGIGWLALLVLSFLGPTVTSTRPIVAVHPYALPAPPPAGAWAQHPADPPHVRRWWDGRGWTSHTTVV